MSTNVRALRTKVYHRAALIHPNGSVSALCFKTPHAIDLSKATWTNRDEAVTCPKCLRLMEAKQGRTT